MNWQYLKYFEVVARQEHYTRAADELFITQSALSKSIDNLERELGFPLFEKQGRNIKLTKYGQLFSNHVTKATKEIEDSVSMIRNLLSPENGVVSFSSIFTLGAEYMPNIIKDFSASHPNIKLLYYQESTTNILENVDSGNIDFGFCGEFDREKYPDFECEPIMIEELVVIVPKDHPLADRREIHFDEVINDTFIGYTGNTGIIHSLSNTLGRPIGGIEAPNIFYAANEDNTVAGLVRAGLGVGIVADNPAIRFDNLSVLHVTNPRLTRTLYLCWKKGRFLSPASKLFKYYVLSNISASDMTAGDQLIGRNMED